MWMLSEALLNVCFLGKGRAVASLTVPGGQEFHFPHFFPKFWSFFLIFPQIFLIFFLILALRVGDSPTREGPGYATESTITFTKIILLAGKCFRLPFPLRSTAKKKKKKKKELWCCPPVEYLNIWVDCRGWCNVIPANISSFTYHVIISHSHTPYSHWNVYKLVKLTMFI